MVEFVAGIDEAGRGPLIGPLVIAVAAIEKDNEPLLKELGVKDSKLLSENQREDILRELEHRLRYEIVQLQPIDIDSSVLSKSHNLNWLEADQGASLLNKIDAKLDNDITKAIIDCPSTNIKAYKDYFSERVDNKEIELVVEHKADFNHLIVGAASIIAKVTREKELEKLRHKFKEDFGSGYPSDPKTKEFLKHNWNNPKYSILFRKSWSTYTDMKNKGRQSSLEKF